MRFLLLPTAIVRPLSSLAKFSFVISNIRFPPGKRAPWQDTGMPASHYACQSPLNKIVLILRRACGVIFEASPRHAGVARRLATQYARLAHLARRSASAHRRRCCRLVL